jgi:hypothetical protein
VIEFRKLYIVRRWCEEPYSKYVVFYSGARTVGTLYDLLDLNALPVTRTERPSGLRHPKHCAKLN